jgi:hypothetical protein
MESGLGEATHDPQGDRLADTNARAVDRHALERR